MQSPGTITRLFGPRGVAWVLLALLGAGLLGEGGLRLYFHEHEADRAYWGRGAFRSVAGYPYRHALSTTATIGREGSFGPHRINTNSLGYRDPRTPEPRKNAPRLVLAGSSYAFGIGIESDADLLHAQLERLLRERPDWPANLEVYNLSQTGFNLANLVRLLDDEIDRFDPDAIVLALSPLAWRAQVLAEADVVDGYRLSPSRLFRGSSLDRLRTRSYLVMRWRNPFQGGGEFHERKLLASFTAAGRRAEAMRRAREIQQNVGVMLDSLAALAERLRRRGVPIYCVPLGQDTQAGTAALEELGLWALAVPTRPEWRIPSDLHWNERGHREAAAAIASALPALHPAAP